ncbi:MAG: DNA-processing protein DprA [Clostridia bacterium]|nr:DNA-processing protein DprA [Clostridia bacterium]
MSHPAYWIALQAALGYHSKKVASLMDFFGDAEGVFEATEQEIRRCPVLSEKEKTAILARPFQKSKAIWNECVQSGITPIGPDDPLYPDGLRNLPDMPCVLYVKGTLPRFDRVPAISVIGTRKPTIYGRLVCERVSSVLAAAGVVVVSGGAMGLDSVAHQSALDAGGSTVAILGCGINYPYLKEKGPMREAIAKQGALISEYPPNAPATRYTFPARNRLIAAISLGTVVIEAGEKSGTLITADFALDQGKDIFAIPGSIMSPSFRGSNCLIAQGATPVFSGLDILSKYEQEYFHHLNMNQARDLHKKQIKEMIQVEEVLPLPEEESTVVEEKPISKPKKIAQSTPKDLSDMASLVYNTLLDKGDLPLHLLVEHTQMETAVLLRELTKMELNGILIKNPTGNYQLKQ